MSHFTVLVFDEDYDTALAPFDENFDVDAYKREETQWVKQQAERILKDQGVKGRNPSLETMARVVNKAWSDCAYFVEDGAIFEMTTRNPEGYWDWHVLGGRWRGFFPLKKGVAYDPGFHLGEPGTFEALAIRDGKEVPDHIAKRMADRVRVGDIDFAKARDQADANAREHFAKWKACFEKYGRPESWKSIHGRIGTPEVLSISDARDIYHKQKAIKNFKAFGCPVDELGFDEGAYAKDCRDHALVPYAVVYEGEWMAKGEMGMFGISHNEGEPENWAASVGRLYEEAGDDQVVSLVDCHV
jgi:hypothetical protein